MIEDNKARIPPHISSLFAVLVILCSSLKGVSGKTWELSWECSIVEYFF